MNETNQYSLTNDRRIPSKELLRRAMPYIAKEWLSFVISFFLLLLRVVAGVMLPKFEQWLIASLESPSPVLDQILGFAIGYAIIAVAESIIMYGDAMILCKAGERIVYRLRNEVYQHILKMSQNQFTTMPVGSLVTRVASYTASVSDLFTNVLVNLLVNILTVFAVWLMMALISWQLSLIMLCFMVVLFIISFVFDKYIHGVFMKERHLISEMNTKLEESLSGIKIIQIFNQEAKKAAEFEEANEGIRKARFNVVFAFGIYRPVVSFLFFAAIAATFYLGPNLALTGAEIVSFYIYLSQFFNPVQNIADQLNQINRGFTALERIFNLLDVPPEVVDDPEAIELDHVEGKIEFDHVYFAYEGENWVLRDVSFVIEPRQSVAFVGATGAGKTTILGLIVRNFVPQKGRILIDGIDIAKIKISSLRRLTGQMLQDVFLFSGTVRDNITLYDGSHSQEELEEACRYVNADRFIQRLSHGYDEILSERGENLSQGQRQLLSFARTVLHRPNILILDEATANIDTETESVIQQSLEAMKSIGTMIVVAHRLSTIQKSDNIIVLHKGKLIEQGNHQQLLALKGAYYKLYQLQFEENI